MKITANDYRTNFFHYKNEDNHFSGFVTDKSYHFDDGFEVYIVIVKYGQENEYSLDFPDKFRAFCFLHSFYNTFFGG